MRKQTINKVKKQYIFVSKKNPNTSRNNNLKVKINFKKTNRFTNKSYVEEGESKIKATVKQQFEEGNFSYK